MGQYYDPYGRNRGAARRVNDTGRRMPTVDDYDALAYAYEQAQATLQELKSQSLAQEKALDAVRQELDIKNEALHRQGEALKDTENELLWTRAALEEARREAEAEQSESWKARYQRLQADLENLRRRWEQRFDDEVAGARHKILLDMLPLADNLDLAIQHATDASQSAAGQDGPTADFIANIEATRRAFMETLKRYGVERIDPLHVQFDPTVHEAVGQVVVDGVPHDHVAQVLQAGYTEGNRLIRPARVLVNTGRADE